MKFRCAHRVFPQSSSLGLGWDEFSHELVELFASVKLVMFLFKHKGMSETFINDQQGVIHEMVIWPRDWTSRDSLQVLTKCLNVTPKPADAQQSGHGARKE